MSAWTAVWITVATLLVWTAFSVSVLFWGTGLFRRLLGEDDSFEKDDRESDLLWLYFTGILSLCAALIGISWFTVSSLAIVFVIPVLMAVLRTVRLRFMDRESRKKEFVWRNNTLVRATDGTSLVPTYAKLDAGYLWTRPASGRGSYSLELFNDQGLMARNAYIHANPVDRDVNRLVQSNCRFLDAQVVWQESPAVFYACSLAPWEELLCGWPDTMPEAPRRFWRQWVRPDFPADGSVEVATAELRKHLKPLLAADPEKGRQLTHLLEKAGPCVRIMSERARMSLGAGRGGRTPSVLELENGVSKVIFKSQN